MIKKPYTRQDAERLQPLIISIGREVEERASMIAQLEARLSAATAADEERSGGAAPIVSELSLHRRELRSAEKELSRFGCDVDVESPLRIVCPAVAGTWVFDLRSGGTYPRAMPAKRGS